MESTGTGANRLSRRCRPWWWWAYQPYKYLVFMPILGVSTLVLGAFAVLLSLVLRPRLVSLTCGVLWARINAYVTPIVVKVVGREHTDPKQSYVVVCNHQSLYDVLVLYGWLGLDFRWVMKQELRKIPGLGPACVRMGHIFVDRSRRKAALASVESAKANIRDGTSVLFFPEGTRSRDGTLGAFKKGAFRFALDLSLPILPVTIVGTRDILPPHTTDVVPGTARLVIHPPVAVVGEPEESPARLAQEVRATIEASLERPGHRRPESGPTAPVPHR